MNDHTSTFFSPRPEDIMTEEKINDLISFIPENEVKYYMVKVDNSGLEYKQIVKFLGETFFNELRGVEFNG